MQGIRDDKWREWRLDELGEPLNTERLNANQRRHGLMPRTPNDASLFLRGDGTWAEMAGEVTIADSANLDAFSRVRTSHPTALFASQCQYDADPLLYEGGATGAGVAPAHSANTRMVTLSATAGTGTSYFQSYEYVPYQPGKSHLVFITGLLDSGVAAVTKDFGVFDANNGVFLRQNGATNLQFVRRTSTSGSVVNNAVAQTDWNLDKLDGTGASGLTLDATKVFILVIDAQFLGMGRIRLGFDIDGSVVYAHEFLNANSLAVPYMQTLALPVQALLTATASAGAASAYFKCAAISSEGGFADDIGYQISTPEQTVTAASGARTHILSLRPLTTFNSITNRCRVRLDEIEILVTGMNPVYWELCIGATFSVAPTYSSVNATYSASQYSSAVGTLSGAGLVIQSGYVASSATAKTAVSAKMGNRYPITLDRAGSVRANGTLSLLVTGITGVSATRASFNFTEIR